MNKIHRIVKETKELDLNNLLIIVDDYSLIFNKELLKDGNTEPKVGRCYTFLSNGNLIKRVIIKTVDICLFSKVNDITYLLSIIRKNEPFRGCLANPGGFVDQGEEDNTLLSAIRELREECSVDINNLTYIDSISSEYRDPRNRYSETDIYSTTLNYLPNIIAGDDASEFKWIMLDIINDKLSLPNGLDLAFDHQMIINLCIDKLN